MIHLRMSIGFQCPCALVFSDARKRHACTSYAHTYVASAKGARPCYAETWFTLTPSAYVLTTPSTSSDSLQCFSSVLCVRIVDRNRSHLQEDELDPTKKNGPWIGLEPRSTRSCGAPSVYVAIAPAFLVKVLPSGCSSVGHRMIRALSNFGGMVCLRGL
jgi:hypothetical protein